MNTDNLKVWEPPNRGYAISSITTFKGKFFTFSTGNKVSTLCLAGHREQEVMLEGRIMVDNESDCWKIATKFLDINEIVLSIANDSFIRGRNDAKKQLREWLELEV